MKNFRIGKMNVDTKSALFGVLVGMVGLSLPPTQSFFNSIYSTIKNVITKIYKK